MVIFNSYVCLPEGSEVSPQSWTIPFTKHLGVLNIIMHHPMSRGIPNVVNFYWGWFIVVITQHRYTSIINILSHSCRISIHILQYIDIIMRILFHYYGISHIIIPLYIQYFPLSHYIISQYPIIIPLLSHDYPIIIPLYSNPTQLSNPICSMSGIFTYIYPTNGSNVGKYAIHGAYGNNWF